jgi:hypothetical protein
MTKLKIKRSFKRKLTNVLFVNYLKQVCTDTGQCIAFGTEQLKLKKVFDNFIHFRYLVNVKHIGQPSANGFVLNLQYTNQGYTTNAVLKSAVTNNGDHPYYEYLVGLFINKLTKTVPCFIETYNLFTYHDNSLKDKLKKKNVPIDVNLFKALELSSCSNNYFSFGGGAARCPRRSRRNKVSGECEPTNAVIYPRCPRRSRRNRVSGECEPMNDNRVIYPRCPKKSRRNRVSGECEPVNNNNNNNNINIMSSMGLVPNHLPTPQYDLPPSPLNVLLNVKCIEESCTNSDKFAILIQYIDKPITLHRFISDGVYLSELYNILYQVYAVLDYCKDCFTHYDLHTENVLLYKLPADKYLTIEYWNENTNTTTTIQTRYLAKIIDYGRSYFNDEEIGSLDIIKYMRTIHCNFDGIPQHYINPHLRNWSHDLRLAKMVVDTLKRKHSNVFEDCHVHFTGRYGTEEYLLNRESADDTIFTVSHMLEYLEYKLRIHGEYIISANDTEYGTMIVSLTNEIGKTPIVFKKKYSAN